MSAPILTTPFSWKNPAYQSFLERLQGNILKGHGRHHTLNIFFSVKTGKADEARTALKVIGTHYATSALKQLKETEDFKEARALGEEFKSDPFVSLMLTHIGYTALNIPAASIPSDQKFRDGMRSRTADLNDPDPSTWDEGFETAPDGMLLIAAQSPGEVDDLAEHLFELMSDGLTVLHRQRGKAILNSRGEGLEHFGYVDGRSQPLFLQEDIDSEKGNAGTMMWDPAFSPDRVLVPDPGAFKHGGGADDEAFGSYFIFRKLEEFVRAFKTREQRLANELSLTGEDRERAGALVVGRFEDGTPVTLSPDPMTPSHGRVPNDFNYDQDPSGGKCPFHAHIRKVNPRESSVASATERLTIMARRGITYEDAPRVHPDDLPEAKTLTEFLEKVAPLLPQKGLGLLFMAYNVNIGVQFEVTQRFWAGGLNFPQPSLPLPDGTIPATGIDPVIGQHGGSNPEQQWPLSYTSEVPVCRPFGFDGFVKLRGGDYFFAPSLTFLRSL